MKKRIQVYLLLFGLMAMFFAMPMQAQDIDHSYKPLKVDLDESGNKLPTIHHLAPAMDYQ